MALRPIFIPVVHGEELVTVRNIEFLWHPGLSKSQKQKSIASLHMAARETTGVSRILEISSKSMDELGVSLSAFNLRLDVKDRYASVETFFQASKIFEQGGPFEDLLARTSREAKRDKRLKESGVLKAFSLLGDEWPLFPKTLFYDWLYINALEKNPELSSQIIDYEAFSDIEFNPRKSINCQGYSAALYVALEKRGLLEQALNSREDFTAVYKTNVSPNTLF